MKNTDYKSLLQQFEASLMTPSQGGSEVTTNPNDNSNSPLSIETSLTPKKPLTTSQLIPEVTSDKPQDSQGTPKKKTSKKKHKTKFDLRAHRQKGHRGRCRSLFLESGLKGWPQHHVLELLLGYSIHRKDTKDLAIDLLDKFGSLKGVLDAPLEELGRVNGVGIVTASLLKLIPALVALYVEEDVDVGLPVDTSKQASQLLQHMFVGATCESTVILCLDGNHRFLGIRKISEGSSLSTSFEVRRVSEEVLRLGGVYIYIAHNHVNTSATPSPQDWDATSYLTSALYHVGIFVKDHLVFGSAGDTISMRESDYEKSRRISWADSLGNI